MFGMTEKEFWESNPRKIKVYEQIYKTKENRRNDLVYSWIGDYGLSALVTAIDGVFNGRKAKAKYSEKPFRLFEMTEEEKEEARRKALAQFMAWTGHAEKKYKKEGG